MILENLLCNIFPSRVLAPDGDAAVDVPQRSAAEASGIEAMNLKRRNWVTRVGERGDAVVGGMDDGAVNVFDRGDADLIPVEAAKSCLHRL